MTEGEKRSYAAIRSEALVTRMLVTVPLDVLSERCIDDAPRDFSSEVDFSLSIALLSDTSPLGQALRERNVGP